MKVVFVGPSLYGEEIHFGEIVVRPPARQGDITRALKDGAKMIGLIDGVFGTVGAVWHKEILYAMSEGVTVLGASSMGALRAAECQLFGMIPVGRIASLYCSGAIDDDAAVTLLVAPKEMGWQPLTEPYVDVISTLSKLRAMRRLSAKEMYRIAACAGGIHFSARTPEAIARTAFGDGEGSEKFLNDYYRWHRSQKRRDAKALIRKIQSLSIPEPSRPSWTFQSSPMWKSFVATNA